jgi:hypothetical protein
MNRRGQGVATPPIEDQPMDNASPKWSGTLVVEWRDRGLHEQQELSLRQARLMLVVLAIGGGLLFLTSARQSVALLYTGGMASLYAVPIVWLKVRHRHCADMTMTLDEGAVRVVRRAGQSVGTTELARSDAGLLARVVSGGSWKKSSRLELEDSTGDIRIELLERDVRVRSWPFGMDLSSYGIKGAELPLDVLIGSWWPNPEHRYARANKSRLSFRDSPDRFWERPDLAGYARSKARTQAREGIFMAATGFGMLGLITFVLLSSKTTGDLWPLGLIVAVSIACASYGAWRVWGSRLALKRH